MGEWKERTLSEIGTIVGGATPSTKKPENYDGGTIPWITPKDLSDFTGRYIRCGERNITEVGLKSCSTQLMPKHTVLFSSRAPIGYVAIAENEVCTNQGFKSVIPGDDVDYLFLYYLLKYNKDAIASMGAGTTFKEVSGNTMRSVRVKIPVDVDEQKKIAGVLDSIDSKIDENNAINKNLSEQAQTLYKQLILDAADESWTYGVLSDVADITMGQSPKGDTYNEDGEGTVFYQGRAEFGDRFPTRRLFTTDPKRMAQENDVLLSVRAPVGDLNVASESCCIGRGLGAIRSTNNHQSYVLYTMMALRHQLDKYNSEGTVFGSINRDALNKMELAIPPVNVIDTFENIVAPMDIAIRRNYEENCRLIAMRDILLPRLISGNLNVSAIDI